ncbi:MAG: hypothetical protein AWT59_1165 [Candidatus Gallionella acididurans]|uniref:Uncharacterized protein n=1 Tax=Candidatus Gallionella acididurans TaxID=1796491 RepID=A0A139BUR8_9PROT|nr:MAG: hypothetical protein AWT59_1165 [Candidatus Gallionella acididurans]
MNARPVKVCEIADTVNLLIAIFFATPVK